MGYSARHPHIKKVVGCSKATYHCPDAIPMIAQLVNEEGHHKEGNDNTYEGL